MFKILMMLLTVVISSQAMAEKIYKWVDENGQIHYSSKKPENQEAKTVKVRKDPKVVPAPAPEDTESATADADDGTGEDTAAEDAENEAAAREQLAAADRVNNQKMCDLARNNLNALNASVKIARENEQGEMVRMTDEERVQAMQTAQQGIRQYCQ